VAGGHVIPESRFFQTVQLTELTLRVEDLPRAQAFYQDVLGFARLETTSSRVSLAPPGAAVGLIVLDDAPDAPPRARATAGLFHVALLYPDRPALARALHRVLDLGIPIGSADHGVSEAIYLSDPEGNGIELYADRPPDAWPPVADGQVTMYSEALDLGSVLAQAHAPGPLLPAATRIGHIHLSVADLAHAERFYGDALGFDVTQRSYPGALFLGRDGYHHHIGANTWRSRQAAQPGTLGLAEFTLRVNDAVEFEAIVARLEAAGHLRDTANGVVAEDVDGLRVRINPPARAARSVPDR
jgi:catechol 2,3-dioxygenase